MKRNFTSLTSKNIHLLLWVGFFLLTIGHLSAQNVCMTMPEPVSYTQVGTPTNKKVTEFTTIRGVRVDRVLEAGNRSIDNIQYATDDNTPDETYCGKDRKTTFKGGNKKYPFMDSNKVKKITYKFSKPVNDIEVFLAAFGYNGTREWWKQNTPHKDVVKFTVNNGGEINLALRSSCTAGAVTISGDVVSSEDKKTTDAKVGISSSTPFTELTLEFLEPSGQTGGYGFFVEICLASIVTPIESSTCTSPIINDPFTTFPNQTVSVAGISITRKVDTGISKAGSFSGSHCGSTKTYPSKDPLLKDSKKIVYEFSTPVKSAEIFLLAFGDNTQVNSFDKAKFEVNGGGAISLSKSYDCNPIVSTINNNVVESVSNRKLTTDVGIKIASSKPFSRITITDMGSTGYGYLVALCPTSIVKATDDDIFTIDKTLTAQSVCEDAMTGVPPSYQAQATSKFNGGSFKYELQAKKSGSSSWLTIATQDNKTSGTNINFVEANLGTLPYDQANIRVKYTYKNPSEFSEEIVRYSNVATLTVSEAKVTKLTATPLSITQGITTNVAYRIEGTSNATVTYQVNGGTPQTVGLNNSGVATVTLPTSQATTFKITRVQKGACNITQNKQVQVTAAFNNGLCTTKPNSLFTTTNDATYTINNITVTRSYVGGTTPNNFLTSSLNDPTEYCSVYPANSNYPWLQKANNRITSVTYKFSQPVNNVEVWLLIMGKGAVGTVDKAKFSINAGCGNPTLSLVADCKGTATINGTTVSENNLIGTDLAVKVTATKPFTELTITDDNSTAGGFLVELCPASIKKQGTGNTDAVTISTQLTATTTACVGFTTTLTTQATLASPFSGSLSYQWQKSTNNGTTWSDISGQSGSATSGANVTYSFTPTTSDNNALYRVAYTYTHAGSFCGTLSLTTNATKLVANTVSSVIAINTPAYTDVAVCATTTGTTTITAKATLNTGMGGTGVTYQLQYRPTDTANWVDHATQKYTLVTGGAEKILTIANVASNTGYYRVKYTSDASVCGGGESYSNIFKFDALTATNVITINPATYPNKTVCSGSSFTINAQATVATGNIANDGSGNKFAYELQYKANSSANWVLYTLPNGGAAQIYSNNTKVGATRTFNISTENIATGGKFRVKYSADITDLCDDITVYSDEFTVTIDELDVTNITATPPVFKQGENTSVSFVIEGTPGAQVTFKVGNGAEQTQTLNAAGKYNVPPQTTNQTLELSVTKVKKGTCEKTYTDKKGRAQATTAACTTKPAIQYPAPVGQGQTAVMNGVTVTRKFSGTPSIYGNSDTGTYCSGTVYHHYTIIHNNLPAQFSNAVTYVFSKPVTSTEVWLMVMSSPATGSYDEVQLTTNNGNLTFTKIYDCLGGAGAVTLSPSGRVTSKPEKVNDVAIRVSSDKPFTELTITDVRATGGTSGVLVELCPTSVTPANTITITTQPQNKTICANEMATFTSKAQLQNATGSIQYKWQQSNNGTNWTDIASSQGTITSGATASLTTAGIANYKYRVVYSYKFTADVVVTATSQEVTLTKLPSVALPTLSGNMTLCPTATPNNVSFDNYVTPAVGTTLRWYATPTATASTTVAPTINTNVTTRTTATAYVRAINNNGCTSGLVTVTLTVNDTTPPTFNAPSALNIVCNSTTATTAINTWLGTATATDACGAIATITNNYNAPADFCTVPGGVITVIFVAKDTFGNVTTKTSTIKLAATLTVASDTFTVGNGVTTQTAGNILTNDNLGGNTPTAGPTGSVTITVVTPATPIGGGKTPTLDVNTGIVTVPAGTKSGTYTITYKECESLNPSSNCQTQTVVISVGSASLTVVPETLTVTPSTSTQTTPSIFDNDSIGGVTTPTAGPGGNVTMTVHNPSGSKVPTMDPNTGKVTVPGNTPAGNYTITYNYCEVLNPTNCTGTRTVVVTVGAPELVVPSKVYPLAPGTTSTETVIDTATLGGNPVSSTAVTIAVVTPATSLGGTPTPTLNTTTGKITVPTGTKSGTYNIVYRVCEVLNPSNCKTATATVVVGEVPVITPDNLPIVPSTPTSTTTRTIGNILTNDTVGTQSATAGTGGNVTITITSPITPNTPVIDPTTGNVQIPPTTPPGVYTITYDVCTTATPVACTSGTLTVTVSQPSPIIRPENLTVTQTGTSTTPSILNNDDIVKPDGTTASATGSNVTITNVVVTPGAAPGAPTPTLNPDGTITVPGTLPPGVYTITYDVCTTATPSTCVSGTTVLTVSPTATATPTAGDNTYDVPTSGTATVVGTILSNDTVDGVASATATNVTVSVTTAPTGTGVPTIGSNGSVTVPANAIPGVYTYTYHICSVATPTACSTEATVTVTVRQPVPVLPNNNMVYTDTTTTTAGNITTGGTVGTQSVTTGPTGNVTITVVTPATPQVPGGTVPTLNPDGTVTVPTGTASGTYTITYQVCTTATPTSCVTGVVTITVSPTTVTPTVLPVAVDDRASTAVNTPVNIAVLPNDTLNGATTPNVVTSPANGTVMVNSDNTIEYRPHTGFTGTDTFVYEICNSAGCSSATVTVEVVNKIIPYSGMSVNGDGKNDHFHIGGIENYPNNVVRIYNRWGVKVFEVNGYDNVTRVFRGISDARATVEAADKLPQGTYYYVIEYYDQNNKKQSEVGWLYLKK
ncbi:gliding motility-associated C-terminal domain-containing protein [Capnocytophaga genosp. AHN8471]|uniref:T9SS type B sorting domain-containing protein n=1 Tax=Capnocytophaga genosp. AHN8471 TaxID=327574 RepID=UPI001931E102|nr:gliding motility-associated C-terminal domain-containing protein [Capnocytophaga genosp. AHN8471]MBM0660478.1 gliding motility-associated C-terminal domain-containing protein [Capnocytophaga genosp. AHN8471]